MAMNTGTTTDTDMVTNTETHIDTDMGTDIVMRGHSLVERTTTQTVTHSNIWSRPGPRAQSRTLDVAGTTTETDKVMDTNRYDLSHRRGLGHGHGH